MIAVEQLAFTPSQAALAASVSRPTIYRWMRLDGFPVAHIGGCTRIPADAFRDWLNQQAGVQENADKKKKCPCRCGNTGKGSGKRVGDLVSRERL